ncbi:MAG: hypothetical protein AAGF92_14770 [Myxococcota bacterium]
MFVLTMLLSCAGYAEDTAKPNVVNARQLAEAYLRAEAKGDFRAVRSLLTDSAYLKYTYEWGHGYEDSVYEFDFSKPSTAEDPFGDDAYAATMSGYETLARESQIKRVTTKDDGDVEVHVVVTEKYRYEDYTGTAKAKIRIRVRQVRGVAKIARVMSVTKY